MQPFQNTPIGSIPYFAMVPQKKIGLIKMPINRKVVLKIATASWCIDQYAGLLRMGYGFNAALGFDFTLNTLGFLCLYRDGVEWW